MKFLEVPCVLAINCDIIFLAFQVGLTKTDAAVQTLSDINPDVVLEVKILCSVYRHGIFSRIYVTVKMNLYKHFNDW